MVYFMTIVSTSFIQPQKVVMSGVTVAMSIRSLLNRKQFWRW